MSQGHFRALIVDDQPEVRRLAARALAADGFHCDEAAGGRQAEQMLAAGPYDVVLTDLLMPAPNGYRLAVQLLSRPARPVVVVLTGLVESKVAKDLVRRGVDDILFKPVDYELLATKVRALVERRAGQEAGVHEQRDQPAEPPAAAAWQDLVSRKDAADDLPQLDCYM